MEQPSMVAASIYCSGIDLTPAYSKLNWYPINCQALTKAIAIMEAVGEVSQFC
ncbi:hypothetical protein D1872_280330 [compost metagenome]